MHIFLLFPPSYPNSPTTMLHHLLSSCVSQLTWWQCTLSVCNPSCHLQSLLDSYLDIWIDTSTPWGVGLFVAGCWATWHLTPGWASKSRDIGCAEAIGVKLATLWLTQCGFHDTCFKVHCDNTLVIASFWKGHSRNPACNESLCHTSSLLAASNILLDPMYVQSLSNKAWGVVGAHSLRLLPHVVLPKELFPLLEEY